MEGVRVIVGPWLELLERMTGLVGYVAVNWGKTQVGVEI